MSKYQTRIFINNPEKIPPDNIVEQFFLILKTGDIDQIREYANKYKIQYNLFEPKVKNKLQVGLNNPFHVVLELDNKIADADAKLRIMKFLDQMGAPMESPNDYDVWPIHLAAQMQDEDIVDFFLSKGVS